MSKFSFCFWVFCLVLLSCLVSIHGDGEGDVDVDWNMVMRLPTEGEPGEYHTEDVAKASAVVETKCEARRKLCIFDFDHTLKLGSRYDW